MLRQTAQPARQFLGHPHPCKYREEQISRTHQEHAAVPSRRTTVAEMSAGTVKGTAQRLLCYYHHTEKQHYVITGISLYFCHQNSSKLTSKISRKLGRFLHIYWITKSNKTVKSLTKKLENNTVIKIFNKIVDKPQLLPELITKWEIKSPDKIADTPCCNALYLSSMWQVCMDEAISRHKWVSLILALIEIKFVYSCSKLLFKMHNCFITFSQCEQQTRLFQTVTDSRKDTPQLELLLRTVLYQKTSASGHSHRCQNHESTTTVRPATFHLSLHKILQIIK